MIKQIPAIAWMATIWYSSSRTWPGTGAVFADLPRWILAIFLLIPPDKVVHTGIYALLGALWQIGRSRPDRPLGQPRAAWALATGFGALDEVHQSYVPGRSADPWDLLADAVGALAGVALVRLWQTRHRIMTQPDALQQTDTRGT